MFVSLKLSLIAIAGVIHAVIPYIFQRTVSHGISDIDGLMAEHIGNPGGTD